MRTPTHAWEEMNDIKRHKNGAWILVEVCGTCYNGSVYYTAWNTDTQRQYRGAENPAGLPEVDYYFQRATCDCMEHDIA